MSTDFHGCARILVVGEVRMGMRSLRCETTSWGLE
jgi:hypothetical protein